MGDLIIMEQKETLPDYCNIPFRDKNDKECFKFGLEPTYYFNPAPMENLRCMSGYITADPGTKFIAIDYTYSNGETTKCIVPYNEEFRDKQICLINSEKFFNNFVPSYIYKETYYKLGEIKVDDWVTRARLIQEVLLMVSDPQYKDDLLSAIFEYDDDFISSIVVSGDAFYYLDRKRLWYRYMKEIIYTHGVISMLYIKLKEGRYNDEN